ncbi:hypothetical protein, partial [Propionivibrio sp.]|uniref:hypothetical protein n=1 Tax=Propionivibrio sp. TaxID=2212460 RepID=UPI003BF28E66
AAVRRGKNGHGAAPAQSRGSTPNAAKSFTCVFHAQKRSFLSMETENLCCTSRSIVCEGLENHS